METVSKAYESKRISRYIANKTRSDVCIKREYVINPHGDTDYCTKGIKSIGIENGNFVLFEK